MLRILSLLFVALFSLTVISGDIVAAAPPGKWQTSPLKVTVVQGQAKTLKKFYRANKEILKPRLTLSANIRKMVKLNYKKLATLKPKQKMFFSVRLVPNVETKPKVYRGTLTLTGTVKQKSAELDAGAVVPGDVSDRAKVLGRLPVVVTVASDGRTTIVVSAVEEDEVTPAGAGLSVLVDGTAIGTTDANGRLVSRIPSGSPTIAVLQPFLGAGSSTVGLTGVKTNVKVVVTGDKLADAYPHAFEFLSGSVVPGDATQLSMRFVDPAQATLTPVDVQSAIVLTTNGSFVADLADTTKIQPDGTLLVSDTAALAPILASEAEMEIEVTAGGPNGSLFTGSAAFRVGKASITGKVTAPPSTPALNVAGLPVTLTLLGTSYGATAVSGPDGSFAFPNIPVGNVSLAVETVQNDVTFAGVGTLFAESSYNVLLRPLAAADFTAGVLPLEVLPPTGSTAKAGPIDPARAAVAVPSIPKLSSGKAVSGKKVTSGLAQAIGSSKDFVQVGYATLDLPAGTPSVSLTFKTDTIEYPTYVLSQSRFNDVWSVSVWGPKGPLMPPLVRNVNSQLFIEPFWIPQGTWGTTGNIVRTLDTSAITAGGAAQIVVVVTSVNIGDSALPTTVQASLSTDGVFSAKVNKLIDAVDGPEDHVSLPLAPNSNLNQKQIEVGMVVPKGFDWPSVKATVEVLSSANATSGPVIHDGAPLSINGFETHGVITLPATIQSPTASPFTDVNTSVLRYKVTVKGQVLGPSQATDVSTEATSQILNPLWRMPEGIARYSVREPGWDDWSRYGTYRWLQSVTGIIPAVNDISGEHGMTIPGDKPHKTHKRGTDIDTFQFWSLDTKAGKFNYNALHQAAQTAVLKPETDPEGAAARVTVANAIKAQRDGLTALDNTASGVVSRFIVGLGAPIPIGIAGPSVLPSGWLKSALVTGTIIGANGTVVDLGLGGFTLTKLSFDHGHNDHNHVTLDIKQMQSTQ